MMRKCCANIKLIFSAQIHTVPCKFHFIHHWLYTLLRDFMEPRTEISVAKVSRMRTANAELAY